GSLAATVVAGIFAILIFLIGGIALFFSAGDVFSALEEAFDPFAPDPAAALEAVFSPGVIISLLMMFLLFIGVVLFYSGFTNAGMNSMIRNADLEDRSSIELAFTKDFRYRTMMVGRILLISHV